MKEKHFRIDGIDIVTLVAPRYTNPADLVRYVGFAYHRDGRPLFGDAYVLPLNRISKRGQLREMFERFRDDLALSGVDNQIYDPQKRDFRRVANRPFEPDTVYGVVKTLKTILGAFVKGSTDEI